MTLKGLLAVVLVALTTAVAFPAAAQQVIVLPSSEPHVVVDNLGTPVVRVAPPVVPPVLIQSEVRKTDEIVPAASIRMDTVGTPWCAGAYANHVGTNFGGCVR